MAIENGCHVPIFKTHRLAGGKSTHRRVCRAVVARAPGVQSRWGLILQKGAGHEGVETGQAWCICT